MRTGQWQTLRKSVGSKPGKSITIEEQNMNLTMKGMKTTFAVLTFSALTLAAAPATPATSVKKGILVVSFGMSYESTLVIMK